MTGLACGLLAVALLLSIPWWIWLIIVILIYLGK